MRNLPTLDSAKQHAAVIRPFSLAPAPIMLATFLVGFFYSLDALYGERRDRSILFWKSLPVSDRTTVLSKATVPIVVLPAIAFVLSVIAQVVMLFWSTLVLIGSGIGPARLWSEFQFFEGLPIMAYGLIVHVLWFAPIYGWLFLISAWAKRAPVLWAVLPPMAVSFVERIVFNTSYFVSLLRYRAIGAMVEAFDYKPSPNAHGDFEHLSQLHPLNFLSSPGLWLGLMFAAACLAAVVRLRRNREPI
jgi:ABC-2 type transport system permease protein